MQQDDPPAPLLLWNALVVFGSLLLLTGALFKSALVSVFVWISSALGYGQRWLLRAGLALAALAAAVSLGILPPVEQWGGSIRHAWMLLAVDPHSGAEH